MSTRNELAGKRLTLDLRSVELEKDLDAARHLIHEMVLAAFRREQERDPTAKVEYRACHRKRDEEAVTAMEARAAAPGRVWRAGAGS